MSQELLNALLQKNNGVLRTSDAVAAGLTKDILYRNVKSMGLLKAAHGIYISPDAWTDEFYLLQQQIPKVVFSHETALYLHDLSEKEPMPLTVTVPAKYNNHAFAEKGIEVVYVKAGWYDIGLCKVSTPGGHTVRSYNMERTICDIMRKRSQMDAAVFSYALKGYARRKDKNLPRLMEYAKEMRIEKKVRECMEVLL